MNIFRKFRLIFLIIFISLIVYFLGKEAIEDIILKTECSKYEETGKENIKNYMLNKYDIVPEIKEMYTDYYRSDIFSSSYGKRPELVEYVQGICKYKDKEFCVIVRGDKESTEGYDNYQMEEIMEGFDNYLRENLDYPIYDYLVTFGRSATHLSLGYSHTPDAYYLTKAKFTGKNFVEILNDYNEWNYCSIGDNVEIITVCDSVKDISNDELKRIFGNIENLRIYNMTEDGAKNLSKTVTEKGYFSDYKYLTGGNYNYIDGLKEIIYFGTDMEEYARYENIETGEEIYFK